MKNNWLRYRRIKESNNKLSMEALIDIIRSNKKGWIIIFSNWCNFSLNALKLLNEKNPIMIDLANVEPSFSEVLSELKKLDMISMYHRTRPIIFYDGEFIGGYDELKKII
jgi:glutaredoxin